MRLSLTEMKSGHMLLKGARLFDPALGLDRVADLRIDDGRIAEIGENLDAPEGTDLLEMEGVTVCPGFIDLRSRFGEPGNEDRETVATGLAAAAAGGYVAVCLSPEADPVCDNAGTVEFLLSRAEDSVSSLLPMGAVSKGRKGERLADLGELARAGAAAYSEGQGGLRSSAALRGALSYSRMFGLPLFELPLEESLDGGQVHEGLTSLKMGLKGLPRIAEDIALYRSLRIAEFEDATLHLQLLTTRESMELIHAAKQKGQSVSCDTSPQHLLLNAEDVLDFNPTKRMLPPLRPEADRQALLAAAANGTLDAICSDHQPAEFDQMDREYGYCPYGCASLETAFAVAWEALVEPGHCGLERLIGLFCDGPRAILGLPRPGLEIGEPAELTLLELDQAWTYRGAEALSLGVNSPWEGHTFRVRPLGIINGDQAAMREETD